MDWADFFEKTRVAAGAESFAKLAPKIGVTDGAISHYRVGRSVPQVWVVADCLRIQGHPTPEKAAVEIMRAEARTSTERTFWKRLAATAIALCLAVGFALPHKAQAAVPGFDNGHVVYIMRNGIRRFGQRWSSFVGSAWQWLGLWLGSCLRPGTPAKDEIAA